MYSDPKAITDDPVLKWVHRIGREATAKHFKWELKDVDDYLIDTMSRYDVGFFDKHNLKIQTKAGKLIALEDNFVQRKIQESIERQSALGRPVRIKIPKARRHGVSTKIQSLFYRDVIYQENISMMTICHDLDAARGMREMFSRYHTHYDRYKPEKKTTSDKWWKFMPTDVSYLIDTADELDTGRSYTLHRLHLSEVAFYRDPDTLATGLLTSVDDNPNTVIILESTANGLGGWWYDFVMGDNGYELLFFPWFDDPDNSLAFGEGERAEFERSLSNQEKNLLDSFDLTFEQLHWRRAKIRTTYNSDEDKFKQEYPATLEESFLMSGRPYFPVGKVKEEFNRTARNIHYRDGYLEWDKYGKSVKFEEAERGYWRIFSEPRKEWRYRYVTGSDVAEGIPVDGQNKDPDYSVCTVFDRISRRDAARLVARIDTDIFGDEIYKASVYYSSGCETVERNAAGVAVINALKDKENVALFQEEEQARTTDKEKATYGFRTGPNTRDMLLTDFRTWLREGVYNSDDNRLWGQCATFVKDEKGKARGAPGTHDDIVLSAALTVQGLAQTMPPEQLRPEGMKAILPADADIYADEEAHLPYAEF